jgi:hypothetical protein
LVETAALTGNKPPTSVYDEAEPVASETNKLFRLSTVRSLGRERFLPAGTAPSKGEAREQPHARQRILPDFCESLKSRFPDQLEAPRATQEIEESANEILAVNLKRFSWCD